MKTIQKLKKLRLEQIQEQQLSKIKGGEKKDKTKSMPAEIE